MRTLIPRDAFLAELAKQHDILAITSLLRCCSAPFVHAVGLHLGPFVQRFPADRGPLHPRRALRGGESGIVHLLSAPTPSTPAG